jgi:hypothetical protein
VSPRTRHALTLAPSERFSTGCIATLSDGETTFSQHFTGEGSEAVQAVADYCDRHGLRVVCLSTPATVHRDLQGHRREEQPRKQRRVVAIGTRPETLRLPESAMLARIGRRDLWERPREGMEA